MGPWGICIEEESLTPREALSEQGVILGLSLDYPWDPRSPHHHQGAQRHQPLFVINTAKPNQVNLIFKYTFSVFYFIYF